MISGFVVQMKILNYNLTLVATSSCHGVHGVVTKIFQKILSGTASHAQEEIYIIKLDICLTSQKQVSDMNFKAPDYEQKQCYISQEVLRCHHIIKF